MKHVSIWSPVGSSEDAKGAADSSKLAVKKPRPKASSPNRQGPQQRVEQQPVKPEYKIFDEAVHAAKIDQDLSQEMLQDINLEEITGNINEEYNRARHTSISYADYKSVSNINFTSDCRTLLHTYTSSKSQITFSFLPFLGPWRYSGCNTRLPPRRTGFDSRRGRPRIFACMNHAGRCRWLAGFLGDLPSPPGSCNPGAGPYSSHFTLIGSQGHVVKSSPNLSTHSLSQFSISTPPLLMMFTINNQRRVSAAVCTCVHSKLRVRKANGDGATCGQRLYTGNHDVRKLTWHCGDACVCDSGNPSDRQASQSAACSSAVGQFAFVSCNLYCTQVHTAADARRRWRQYGNTGAHPVSLSCGVFRERRGQGQMLKRRGKDGGRELARTATREAGLLGRRDTWRRCCQVANPMLSACQNFSAGIGFTARSGSSSVIQQDRGVSIAVRFQNRRLPDRKTFQRLRERPRDIGLLKHECLYKPHDEGNGGTNNLIIAAVEGMGSLDSLESLAT
ncbi:hypothetical protein PR048_024975 [Dryococelus australis]|uniref:Uncharacterized protein n=1 Tax=Dryococelus australis TaxID=614101 RepID=A0ABQ9GQ69_9NEOP|nr:hypothetical protein PR048_024975 [Dryococelus australis]